MKEIIICYGLPGSGKSKWSKEQLKNKEKNFKRVNKDLLREMIDDSIYNKENEKFILEVRDHIVTKSLNKGKNVIIDDTNFPIGGFHYQRMCEIAKQIGDVQVTEKYFEISLDDAFIANKGPYRHEVPEDVIINMYNKFIVDKNLKTNSVYFPKIQTIKYNKNLKDCIIFDIDGTLAIHNNRNAYDLSRVLEDSCNESVAYINRMLKKTFHINDNLKIIIFSGREDVCKEDIEKWLSINNISYDHLYMRKMNDTRKDTIIKEEMYNTYIKDKYNLISVFDDRDSVVAKWREMGITCFQVNYGDF